MPGIQDWTSCPLNIVDKIFEDTPDKSEYGKKIEQYFNDLIDRNHEMIPSIEGSLGAVCSGSLVQGRYMIQDMFEPEMYADTFAVERKAPAECPTERVLRCSRYRDVIIPQAGEAPCMDSQETKFSDRKVYYCVPVPGESGWSREMAKSSVALPPGDSANEGPVATGAKRSLDQSDEEEPMDSEGCAGDGAQAGGMIDEPDGRPSDKKHKPTTSDAAANPEHSGSKVTGDCHMPLGGETRVPCILKTYSDDPDLLLNDVVDVFGIVSVDPLMAPCQSDDVDMGDSKEEDAAHNPPASRVPRLHALRVTKVQCLHRSLPSSAASEQTDRLRAQVAESLVTVRLALMDQATELCMGDTLAAEYLLCHILASVEFQNQDVPVGKLALNLSGYSKEQAQVLGSWMETIRPVAVNLPMTLENLNDQNLVPMKDYEANVLRSGVLQLPKGSHLCVDETKLDEGQLSDRGVRNVVALGNLIKWQKVIYDFKFHQTDFPCNTSVLILSEGKSMLPSDIRIPLRPVTGSSLTVASVATGDPRWLELLPLVRLYVALGPLTPYELGGEMEKAVQEDFVESRRENPSNMTVEDFELLLTLSRLLCRSLGERTLSMEVWNRVKEMEKERQSRLT